MRQLTPEPDLLLAFRARLSEEERRAVDLLASLADDRSAALYLVGGSVRDLLLGLTHLDLDFVVETDAIGLARAYGKRWGARVTPHAWARTAVVEGGGVRFDLVTARRETYPKPGLLPVVQPSTLADDLARRDFTINAIALALSGPHIGRLVDPHGGRTDLAAGILRVLHDASFRDDATRLWRLGRYTARLGLTLDPHTEHLARRDRGYLDTISPARLLAELLRVLEEPEPERAITLLDELGVLGATHPALRSPADSTAFGRIRALHPRDLHAAYLCALVVQRTMEEITRLIARIEPERKIRHALLALPELRLALSRLPAAARPSAVVEALDRIPEPTLAAWAASFPTTHDGRRVRAYLAEWRHVRSELDGRALMAMGMPAGPAIGETLRLLRAARLDGRVVSLDDERRLVKNTLLKHRPPEE